MTGKESRDVSSKEIRRTSTRYEGWTNGSRLFSKAINLSTSLEVKDLLDDGWTYIDLRPQNIDELHINQEAA